MDARGFPKGEPESEVPKRGYCANCRTEVIWPDDLEAGWPESCPRGCSPLVVTSYLPEPTTGGWHVPCG